MLLMLAFEARAGEAEERLAAFVGQPIGRLSFLGTHRDAGLVQQGQEVVVEYPFEVGGEGAVTILGVHQECGCFSSSFKAGQVLQAGEKGKFVLRVDTSQFVGNFDKSVSILSNQEEGSAFTLRVKAKVEQTLRISPPLVEMNFLAGRTPQSATVKIQSLSKQSLHIEKVAYNEDTFDVQYQALGDAWELKILWKGEAPLRPQFETIDITTDGQVRHLKIPVVGRSLKSAL